jgi:pantothenate kinase
MAAEPAPAQLLRRAAALADQPERAILGITGAPAAGKSTLAHQLVTQLSPRAAYVPLDGFHLAHQLLVELGRVARKGALDTFDAAGFVALLRRLRDPGEGVVYAPKFVREIEDSIANAIPVQPDVPLVVTEGNYLLVQSGPWADVAGLLDEIWYLDLPEEVRLQRLIDRHMSFGRDASEARARATGSDQRNAALIDATRERADLVISLPLDRDANAPRGLPDRWLRWPAPEFAQEPGGCLWLAVAGEDPLMVAAGPVHCLCSGEVGEVPHVLADYLGDPLEYPQ